MDLPNATSEDRDVSSVVHAYTNLAEHQRSGPKTITGGRGIYVYDEQGKEYIEAIAGLWCASMGFGERELVQAAIAQMNQIPFYHIAAGKSTWPVIKVCEKLKEICHGRFSKVFLTNSGSEANDTQIKLLWLYNNARGEPKRKKIIARRKGYHGATIGAGSLTGIPANHRDYDLPLSRMLHVSYPHFTKFAEPGETEEEYSARLADELEQLILAEGPETIAAFIAEPVMGAGGVIVPPRSYFPNIQRVLAKYHVRMIVDEVITGFGRTGNMWGYETFNIAPNSLSCAKALSAAYMPIGAVLIDEDMWQTMVDHSAATGVFAHGYTFSGHPTAAAVAFRHLTLLEERGILEHVRQLSPSFLSALAEFNDHPLVWETRGVGLLGGIELAPRKDRSATFREPGLVGRTYALFAEEEGVIPRAVGDTIAICPPLIITAAEMAEMFDRLRRTLNRTFYWAIREGLVT